MSDWISVDDEMPTDNFVLVCSDTGDICTASHEIKHDGGCWRIGNDQYNWDYDYNLDFCVEYWQSLPPTP